MFAKDLISNVVFPLKESDSGLMALNLMDEFKVSHLPVVDNLHLLGLLSELDVYNFNAPEDPISAYLSYLKKFFVYDSQHIFDVIKAFSSEQLTLLPVIDGQENFLGIIHPSYLIQNFAEITSLINPGGIIILELNSTDYSLSQIAQIIESNDAKVLGLFIHSNNDTTKIEVNIKVNKIDIRAILQTFNRYNYIIKASFTDDEHYYQDLQDRYNSLMNFLKL